MGATYSVYKLPYISSAISVNSENLQSCLSKASLNSSSELRACITNNVSSKIPNSKLGDVLNVTYFASGETVNMTNGTKTITPASNLPNSNCHENFNNDDLTDNTVNNESGNVNIESNKIFCFNGTFTILTIFVLLLLLIFININSKNPIIKNQ